MIIFIIAAIFLSIGLYAVYKPKSMKCSCGHRIPVRGLGWYTCTECRQDRFYFDANS